MSFFFKDPITFSKRPQGTDEFSRKLVAYDGSGFGWIVTPDLSGTGITLQPNPTFYRDFVTYKTLNHGEGPNITFTRGTSATYFDANGVLKIAGINEPRFDHDPVTLESKGFLIEDQRVNLLLRSAEFNESAWNKTANPVTVTANQIVAPDGTTSADLIAGTTDNDRHYALQIVSGATAGATYTASIFVKAGTQRYIVFGDAGDTSWRLLTFDFNTLSISHSTGVTSSSAISVGNGWYRLSLTATRANSASYQIFVGFSNAATNSAPPVYVESPSDTFYIWGAQLELGAFATSYIPTAGSEGTRAVDVVSVSAVSSFYNAVEGTMFSEFQAVSSIDATHLGFDNSLSNNRIHLTIANGIPSVAVTSGGSTQVSGIPIGSAVTSGQINKFAAALKQNDFQAARNGTLGTPDTLGLMPTGISRMQIGRRQTSAFYTGHIRKIAYYPKRLSDALLENLTT